MTKLATWALLSAAVFLCASPPHAQQIEAVHALNFENTGRAARAIDILFEDDAMDGARVTMYVGEFGELPSSHLIVVDHDSYDEYMEQNEARLASHGWAQFQLRTQDAEYAGGTLVSVVDDHGAPRHTAGYLVAYLIHTTDPGTYRSAIADLDAAVGNPGVLRLVALRSGSMAATHAVLIGGEHFAAVNEYLDELYASEAFDEFAAKVGDTRKVVGVEWWRRVETWGD